MMKRVVFIMVAVFLMGSMAMAQPARRGDRTPDAKARAERMTERMAKEYSLNDAQKKQLLEANQALVATMGEMPMRHRADKKKGKQSCCCCCASDNCKKKENKHAAKNECRNAQPTEEQRAQLKADREKKMAGMKTARESYDAQLKKIMTKDQYAAYIKGMQDRKDKKRKG